MAETSRNREPLSLEQIKKNLDAYLDNVTETVTERAQENIKINLVFIVETGMHINCYFRDQRTIESLGRYSDTISSIKHDKDNPLSAISISAVIGRSENYLQILASGSTHRDERVSEIDIANPGIIRNIVFKVELD